HLCRALLHLLTLSPCCFRTRPPPSSTLFPYTTLFRSRCVGAEAAALLRRLHGDRAGALTGHGQGGDTRRRSRRTQAGDGAGAGGDRKSTRLNSSHGSISYAVFCLKKKNTPSK